MHGARPIANGSTVVTIGTTGQNFRFGNNLQPYVKLLVNFGVFCTQELLAKLTIRRCHRIKDGYRTRKMVTMATKAWALPSCRKGILKLKTLKFVSSCILHYKAFVQCPPKLFF